MSKQININEADEHNVPGYKLFSLPGMVIASVFGSILVGGILMGRNYQRLGEVHKARLTYWFTALATLAGFCGAMFLPDDGPTAPFAVALVVALAFIMNHLQGPFIVRHLEQKGLMESNWKALGISLLVTIAMVVSVIFVIAILQ